MAVRLPAVRVVQQADLAEQLSQTGLSTPLTQLTKDPMLSANTVRGIEFGGGGATVRVSHGLGYAPSGWVVTRARGAAPSIFEESSDARIIVFRSASAATLDIRFW